MSHSESRPQKIHALVVDDGEIEQKLMAHYLSRVSNYAVTCIAAMNCEKAIEVLKAEKIDVCFLDYYLDGEIGTDLVEALNELNIEVPIVMITGLDEQELERLVYPYGIKHTLSKEQLSSNELDNTLLNVLA